MRLAVAASFVLVCANLYAAAPTATAKTPAPQNVNVRNLPLAGDGSVRVKCGQSGVTYDLLDGVLPLSRVCSNGAICRTMYGLGTMGHVGATHTARRTRPAVRWLDQSSAPDVAAPIMTRMLPTFGSTSGTNVPVATLLLVGPHLPGRRTFAGRAGRKTNPTSTRSVSDSSASPWLSNVMYL
jgi:hypothetical protein